MSCVGIEACRWLVQDQDGGKSDEGTGDGEAVGVALACYVTITMISSLPALFSTTYTLPKAPTDQHIGDLTQAELC